MQADRSYTAYPEGRGTRHVRDELFTYGAHNHDTGSRTQHVGIRRYSLWVSSQFGDGALTRYFVYPDHREFSYHETNRCTRDDVDMWLPIVRDGLGFGA